MLDGVVGCGCAGVDAAPPLLEGGCSGPAAAPKAPGIGAGMTVNPAAAAAAMAGSLESLGSSGGSGSMPGFSGGAPFSCVMNGEEFWYG